MNAFFHFCASYLKCFPFKDGCRFTLTGTLDHSVLYIGALLLFVFSPCFIITMLNLFLLGLCLKNVLKKGFSRYKWHLNHEKNLMCLILILLAHFLDLLLQVIKMNTKLRQKMT